MTQVDDQIIQRCLSYGLSDLRDYLHSMMEIQKLSQNKNDKYTELKKETDQLQYFYNKLFKLHSSLSDNHRDHYHKIWSNYQDVTVCKLLILVSSIIIIIQFGLFCAKFY